MAARRARLLIAYWQRLFSPEVLHWGLLLLLIWTPLAFGAVHPLATGLMEIHIFLLVALWMGGRLGVFGERAHRHPVATPGRLALSLFVLFVSLLLFQLLQLPPDALQWLSPSTFSLYSQFMPNWPDTNVPLSLHATATRASVVKFLAYASLFFLVTDTIQTRRQFRLVVQVIVGVAFSISLLGMAQYFSGTTSIYWLRDTSYAPEFFGPYINRNHGAAYLVMALLLGLGLLFTRRSRADSDRSASYGQGLLQTIEYWVGRRGLWVYLLAVITGALCLALSRGALLSLLAGTTLFVLLRRPSPSAPRPWRRWGWLLGMIIVVGLWVGVEPLLNRLTVAQMSSEFSSSGRLGLWQATWDMAKSFPLWGIGYAAYPVVFPRYQTADLDGYFLQAHNDLLQLVAETGWVGGSLFVGLLLLVVSDIVRRWRRRKDPFIREMIPAGLSALVAMACHALVDFNFHIPANALLFTVILALLYAGVRLPHRGQRGSVASKERGWNGGWRCRAVLATSGVACALWLCYGVTRVVIADLLYPQQAFVRPHHWTQQASYDLKRKRLQGALRWHPNQDMYWLNLADLEVEAARQNGSSEDGQPLSVMASHLRQADLWYQRALQQRPTDPDAHLRRLFSLHALTSSSPEEADPSDPGLAAYAARVATLAPTNSDLQYRLGAILLSRETASSGPAVDTRQSGLTSSHFFQQAILLRPTLVKELWQLFLRSLPTAEALARFALAIPQTTEGLFAAASLMEDQSWLQARSFYLAGLALASSQPPVMKRYGEALNRHGAYAAALEIWQQLQVATPHDAEVYLELANTQNRLGDSAGALQTLGQLVTRFPNQPTYHHQLAAMYLRLGQFVEARVEWQTLLRRFPNFVHAYVGLAQAYERQQDYSGSIAMMRKATHMAPGSIPFYGHLARLYRKLGSPVIALREYERLEAFHPNNPDVLYQIGVYAEWAGERQRAREYYLRALRLSPDNARFRQALDNLAIELSSSDQHMKPLAR